MSNSNNTVSDSPDFDPNSHINAVNAAYISRKSGKGNSPFYTSPIGATIKNAVDGHGYPGQVVGSFAEKRFWTVMVNNGKETAKLFYDNPEQYENHRGATVSTEEKDAWRTKQEEYRREEVGLAN